MQYNIERIKSLIKWFLSSDVSDSDVTFVVMYNLYFRRSVYLRRRTCIRSTFQCVVHLISYEITFVHFCAPVIAYRIKLTPHKQRFWTIWLKKEVRLFLTLNNLNTCRQSINISEAYIIQTTRKSFPLLMSYKTRRRRLKKLCMLIYSLPLIRTF